MTDMQKPLIELELKLVLFSKARPRVTSNGTFMPADYQRKRKEMLAQIKEQYQGQPLEGPIRLEVDLYGEGRADADNLVGALLDTANGYLWVDDRVSVIPQIEVRWHKALKIRSRWVIRIYPLDCEQRSFFQSGRTLF